MAKAQRRSSGGKFVVTPASGDKPASLRNRETGEVLVLHGYGSMKGKLELRKAIDLTKPIYEQVLKLEVREKRRSSTKRTHKKA